MDVAPAIERAEVVYINSTSCLKMGTDSGRDLPHEIMALPRQPFGRRTARGVLVLSIDEHDLYRRIRPLHLGYDGGEVVRGRSYQRWY